MAYRRYRRSHYNSRDYGHERARQHIEDYHRLEAELGGSLEDVKQFFFALSPQQLQRILRSYGQKYGESARDYAEKTIAKWKTSRVHMAGQTAERLFRLLPSHMPLEGKYRLIENLWNHVGATTRKTLRIGLDATVEQVIEAVRKYLDDVVVQHRIPPTLEGRFNWLAADDAQVKQDLLNHLRQHMDKNLALEAARLQLPIMQEHLRGETGKHTFRLAQILKLGNHELELLIDKNVSGVAVVEPHTPIQHTINQIGSTRNAAATASTASTAASAAAAAPAKRGSLKWLWWLAAAAVVLYFLIRERTPTSSYQPNTYAITPLQSKTPTPLPQQNGSASIRQPDALADHGPGRVACDLQWSQARTHNSSYRDFIGDCMSRSLE